jgi:hypothetical protein
VGVHAQSIELSPVQTIWTGFGPLGANAETITIAPGASKLVWGEPLISVRPEGSAGEYWGVANGKSACLALINKETAETAGAPVPLGFFEHINLPVQGSITGAELEIFMDMIVFPQGAGQGISVQAPFTFLFDHEEDDDSDDQRPCPFGTELQNSDGCADRVTIHPAAPAVFTIGDFEYKVSLYFDIPQGQLTLITPEQFGSLARLYGVFTATNVVPEPGFYGMLGLCLAGLYAAVRRRKTV